MSVNTVSLNRPFVVRGACVTATATLTNGTNTTLLTGDSAYKLDLVEVTIANNSTLTASVAIKDDGTTVRTLSVPLGGTVQLSFPIPLPQNKAGGDWTADMEDITGTSLSVDAIFIKS